LYNFQQDLNTPYYSKLKAGDIVVAQSVLEKFMESGTNINRAAFKLVGVALLGEGPKPHDDIAILLPPLLNVHSVSFAFNFL